VTLRVLELISASIVAGILGRLLHLVHVGHGHFNDRLVYAVTIAGLSIFFSICLILPFLYSFLAFPLDIIMFILWMVAFGLLEGLVVGGACSSGWYTNYWGFYWGRLWAAPRRSWFGVSGCSSWRTALAFTFIGSILWLLSGCLGAYVLYERRNPNERDELPNSPHSQTSSKSPWYGKKKTEMGTSPGPQHPVA